jgi:hypothetical protein
VGKKKDFLTYLKARRFARSLKFNSKEQWLEYCHMKKRPPNIPCVPQLIYKNRGWISWMDWLGYVFIPKGPRKYKVNDDYFKKWSPNMAYILGFWFADGNIGKRNSYIFNITQNKKDKYLLEAILREMKSDYPLAFVPSCDCYGFHICSKSIYDDIIKLGGKERKSLDVKFPHVPKKYLPDFVRGLWDGDGCITFNKIHKTYDSNYISGSKDFIEQLHNVLKKSIPRLGGSLTLQRLSGAYRLMFGRNDTIRLRKFIYQKPLNGKLMLKRKHDLFLKTPRFCSNEFLDHNGARKFVRALGIKSRKQWYRYCKSNRLPRNIPYNPSSVYKNLGWVSSASWFGVKDNEKYCNNK